MGQYQHDMPQKRLEEALDGVVEDCVNCGGRGCKHRLCASLLRQVSGLTAATAKNIVAYREENGAFTTRKQLAKVPKLGPKAFRAVRRASYGCRRVRTFWTTPPYIPSPMARRRPCWS